MVRWAAEPVLTLSGRDSPKVQRQIRYGLLSVEEQPNDDGAMKSLVALLTVVCLAFALYKVNFPTYSYRYRLQLSIEVDGRPHTGSSVIQVN